MDMPRADAGTPHRGVVAVALLAYAAAICLRVPGLVTAPRLYAEEGSVYLQHAATHGAAEALVAPHLGYFSLLNTVAAVLATRLVALEHAPAVTTTIALLVQLLPAFVVLTSRAPLFRAPTARATALLVLLFTPLSGSIWLNTISSQFYLSVAAALVAIEVANDGSRARRFAVRGMLALAGLTGPPTCLLLPVFLFRAFRERSRESRIQAGVLTVAAVIQGIAFVASARPDAAAPDRFAGLDPALIGAVALVDTVALPFGGLSSANRLSAAIDRTGAPGTPGFAVLGWGAAVLLVAFLARQRGTAGRLAACYGAIVVPSIVLSAGTGLAEDKSALLTPGFAERYFYGPSVLLVLLALSYATARGDGGTAATAATAATGASAVPAGTTPFAPATAPPPRQPLPDRARPALRVLAGVAVGACVLLGMLDSRRSIRPYVSGNLPAWRDEVAAWRADPDRPIRVWPPTFVVRLPQR